MRSTRLTAPRPITTQRPVPKPRVRVLLVLNSDGFAEVYGPPEVCVHVANRLHTDGGNPADVAADEYLDRTLPRVYRELYYPRNLRASGIVERRTAADELDRRAALAIVADLREIREGTE
jgi:hypothetical protein